MRSHRLSIDEVWSVLRTHPDGPRVASWAASYEHRARYAIAVAMTERCDARTAVDILRALAGCSITLRACITISQSGALKAEIVKLGEELHRPKMRIPPADREDALQNAAETVLRLLADPERLGTIQNLPAYLVTLYQHEQANVARSTQRRHRRIVLAPPDEPSPIDTLLAPDPGPEHVAVTRATFHEASATLTPDERTMLDDLLADAVHGDGLLRHDRAIRARYGATKGRNRFKRLRAKMARAFSPRRDEPRVSPVDPTSDGRNNERNDAFDGREVS